MSLPAAPPLQAVLETGLYVADLARARAFYETVMGLAPMLKDHRMAAYPVGASVLLLFDQHAMGRAEHPFGGTIPAHQGTGGAHHAFAIDASALPAWREHLAAHAVVLEGEVAWPKGAHSVYFRDPDQHLLELVTPGLWANY